MHRRSFLAFAPALGLSSPLAQASASAGVSELVSRSFESGLMPGLQLALAGPDGTMFSAERGLHVRAESKFYLASTTKTFTGLAVAMLADRGAFDLDASLEKLFPGVTWRPETQADQVRARDLLAHGHGLDPDSVPAHQRIAYSGDYASNAQMLGWLAGLKPLAAGRTFSYSNLGPDLIGMALAPGGRDGWKAIVQNELLDPLGLKHCSPWFSRLQAQDVMRPHELQTSQWRPLPANKVDANMGPAGGMYGTASDLARLAQLFLNQGQWAGKPFWSSRVQRQLLQVQQPQKARWMDHDRFGYSLGLDLANVEGEQLATRMGDFRGWHSHFSFMPRRRIGLALLVNGGGVAAAAAYFLAQAIYRHMLGETQRAVAGLDAANATLRAAIAKREDRPAMTVEQWPLSPDQLAGCYWDEQIGEMRLERTAQGMSLHWGVLQSEFELRDSQQGMWRVDWSGRGRIVRPLADADGRVMAIELMGRRLQRRTEGVDCARLSP